MHLFLGKLREQAFYFLDSYHHRDLNRLIGKVELIGCVDGAIVSQTLDGTIQRRSANTQLLRLMEQPLREGHVTVHTILLGEKGDLEPVHDDLRKNRDVLASGAEHDSAVHGDVLSGDEAVVHQEQVGRGQLVDPRGALERDDLLEVGACGLDLCRRYRAKHDVPIVFLSARSEEMDRVLGLEMGADDYLSKPFGTRELVARIKAVLRRAGPAAPEPGTKRGVDRLTLGLLALDIERHEVRVGGHPVMLTHMEFLLLKCLMQRPGVVFERGQLIVESRADDTHITERTIDTHIRRIRAKLREHGLAPIVTVHGVGYKLDLEACSSA